MAFSQVEMAAAKGSQKHMTSRKYRRPTPGQLRHRAGKWRGLSISVLSLALMAMVATPTAQAQETESGQSSVLFVVDTSGSMSGSPLAQAKVALHAGIDALVPGQAAGLRSFSGDCGSGGRLLVPVATDNKDQLNAAASALSASGGTPTPDALRAAASDLPSGGDRTIVLISDGQSSCGNPCEVAKEIKTSLGVGFRVHAVGFNAPANAESELSCIAAATGGQYFTATNTEELSSAISNAVEASNPTCKEIYFLGVRGSGEAPQDQSVVAYETRRELGKPLPRAYPAVSTSAPNPVGFGGPISSTYRGLLYQADRLSLLSPSQISARAIAYPAPPVSEFAINTDKYLSSVTIGAENLRAELQAIRGYCPTGKIVLAGYSQGADVINAAMALEQRAAGASKVMTQVRKIALMGDPSHRPNRPENTGAGGYGSGNGNGASIVMNLYAADAVAYKDSHPNLVASICTIGDIVCDASGGNLADVLSPVTAASGAHTLYPSTKMRCPAVGNVWQSATDCAAQLLVAGIDYTPVARETAGPTVTDTVVTVGNHLYAGIIGVPVAAGNAAVEAGKTVEKLLHVIFKSDPIDLGVVQLDDRGSGIIDFDVPNVPPGLHHLELVASDGRTYVVPIYVTDEQGNQEPVLFAIDGSTADVPPTTPGPNSGSGSVGSLQFGS